MTRSRLTAWTLLAATGFAFLPARPAAAQQENTLPQPDRAANSELNKYKETRGISKDELPNAKKHFEGFAKYYAAIIAHPLVYKAAQDASLKFDSARQTIPSLDGSNGIIPELLRFVPEASLANSGTVTADRADYIRELGVALDGALKPVIETHPDRIVRVNATRLLAAACRSGATAFYPTVTELLTNANTPTEVKHYALQAAASLLAAHDVTDYGSRRHSNGWRQPQAEADKELGALVAAVERCVLDPSAILGGKPGTKLTPDQDEVVRFVRREAIKALGRVRFVTVPGPDGKPLYPAFTLARVCVADPVVVPSPSPSECTEAVIGICNMAPVVNGAPVKNFNANTAVEAVAAGLINFSRKRAEDPADRSLAWRGYGLRLAEALRGWGPLFDPLFVANKPGAAAGAAPPPPAVTDLVQRVQTSLLAPLEKVGIDGKADLVGGRVEIEKLNDYLKQLRASKTRNPLMFTDDKATALYAPAP